MHSFVKVLFLSTGLLVSACSDNSQVFSSSATGAPKQASSSSAGYYKIGNPYQVAGVWYYPKEDYNYKEIGVSSWYGADFHNGITANGEQYDMHSLTAAHRTLPLPSVVRVTNLQNGRSLVLRVNDRGPFVNNRVIDVSMRAAQLLGFKEQGTTQVQVEIMPEESKQLKEELLAGGTGRSVAAVDSQNLPENAAGEIEKPQNLGYSPNYPRLANPPPVALTAEAPLVGATAATPKSNYNDWDSDMSQAQSKKVAYAGPTSLTKPAAAPQKKAVPKPVASKPAPAVQPKTGPVAAGYYVQVGAFGSLENAQKMHDKVARFGSAVIMPVTVNAKTLYRVRIGPESAKKALEIMDKVSNSGIADARLVEEKGTAGQRLDRAF